MKITKRIIDLSTRDLETLQEAILAEIDRRKEIATSLYEAESVAEPVVEAPPMLSIVPAPSDAVPVRKPRRVA